MQEGANQHQITFHGFSLHKGLLFWGWPKDLSIEVTSRCNLRCTHCFQSHFDFPRGDLVPEIWENLKKHLNQIKQINLSAAGEPLLASNFQEIFHWCVKNNLTIGLTTNAQLLNGWIEQFVGTLHSLAVSLDAVTEAAYLQRRRAPVKKVLKALKHLARRKAEQKTTLPSIILICVLNQENATELPLVIEFAHQIKAEAVYAYHQIFYKEEFFRRLSLWFAKDLYHTILKQAVEKARQLGVTLIHPGAFDGSIRAHPKVEEYLKGTPQHFECKWVERSCTITWNGYVQACCFADRLLMGHLKQEDLPAIWNGPAYRRLRSLLSTQKYPQACRFCLFRQIIAPNDPASYLCPHQEEAFYTDLGLWLKSALLPFKKAEALYHKGLQKLQQGSIEAAQKIFIEIYEQDQFYFEAGNALAVTLALQKRKEAAATVWEQIQILFPKESLCHKNLEVLCEL